MISFTCNAATFANAFNTVGRVVASKNGRTGLQSVLAELKDSVLTLTGTDLERTIVQEIEDIAGADGVALLPKETLDKILKSLDGDDEITIKEKDQKLNVSSGPAKWACNTSNPDEFPEIGLPGEDEDVYRVSSADFAKLVERVVFAVDQTKKASGAMAGVNFECVSGTIGSTATDGRRLCHQEVKGEQDQPSAGAAGVADFNVIVPTESLRLVLGVIGNDDVFISMDKESQIWFQIGKTKIASRLMVGFYPKWRNHKPKCSGSFGVIVKPFLKAINQAAIMKNESSNAITFDFSENRVLIYGSQESGNSSIPCEVGWSDEDASFKIDPMFVTDCLKPLGAETLNIQVEDRGMAWVVETDGFYGVMIPIGDKT